jgi:tRNA uridine 5-carboxymethylaminomethyl modification enzyme
LTPVGRGLGIVDDHRWQTFINKRDAVAEELERLQGIMVRSVAMSESDAQILQGGLQKESRAADLLRRPELGYKEVTALSMVGSGEWRDGMSTEQAEQVELQLEVQARYQGYIERQQREIDKHAKQEQLLLPADIEYASVTGLSTEARQRLEVTRPQTIGHASRLEGVTPATVSLLLIHLKKRYLQRSA